MKNFYDIVQKTGVSSKRPLSQIEPALKSKSSYIWLDIDNASIKPEAQKIMGQVFDFHSWTIKQSFASDARPKLEEHDDYLFVVIPALIKNSPTMEMTHLSIFLGANFIVTVHTKPLQAIDDVLKVLPKQDKALYKTPDQLLYHLVDEVVDDYRPIMDELDEKVDAVETAIFSSPKEQTQAKIFRIKKLVLSLRRSVSPLREVVNTLTNRQISFMSARMRLEFRSVYDHILRINDELETFRELMSSAMDSYISQMSNKLNEIMKMLSIVATIMLPLTLITGIWGTNFRFLPGINSQIGFWVMMAFLMLLSFVLIVYFRRRKWF